MNMYLFCKLFCIIFILIFDAPGKCFSKSIQRITLIIAMFMILRVLHLQKIKSFEMQVRMYIDAKQIHLKVTIIRLTKTRETWRKE